MSNYGLVPGMQGINYLQQSPLGNLTGFSGPNTIQDSQASTNLLGGTQYNDMLTAVTQQETGNMQTSFTLGAAIASAEHANTAEAQSFDQQFIGDMIAEEKKSNDNAGKAV